MDALPQERNHVSDSYLWLTPLLTVIVVALVGFVGCDDVWGLQEVPPKSPAPTGFTADAGDMEVILSWDSYADADSFALYRGVQQSDPNPQQIVINDPGATTYPDRPLPNEVTVWYSLKAFVNGKETYTTTPIPATPSRFGVEMPFINPATIQLGTLRQFTSWMGMGFRTATEPLSLRSLGRWYDANQTGSHPVRIAAASAPTVVLAMVTVSKAAASAEGGFVYADVVPSITLAPDTDYYLTSSENAAAEPFYDSADTRVQILNSAAGVSQYAAFGDDAGNYTTSMINGPTYGPVDFRYTFDQ